MGKSFEVGGEGGGAGGATGVMCVYVSASRSVVYTNTSCNDDQMGRKGGQTGIKLCVGKGWGRRQRKRGRGGGVSESEKCQGRFEKVSVGGSGGSTRWRGRSEA